MNGRLGPPVSAISAGVQFAVCVLVSLWLGYQVDRRWGRAPWGTLAGMVLGMLVGTWSVLRPLWRQAEEEPMVEDEVDRKKEEKKR